MSAGIWFWVFFVFGLLFNGYASFNPTWAGSRFGGLVVVILIGLLGLVVFGSPVK